MGQVLSNIIQCLCGEAEDDLERLSHNLLLPPPTPTSQNESNTNSGALLQTALYSSPNSDSCSDLSTSGSSESLDSHGDSTTSSALHQNSHGNLGTACALQQEILISSESLESLGDSSSSGLLQLPMVFYPSTDILSNSHGNSGALLQTALYSSPSSDSCIDLSTSSSSVHLSSLDSHGDSNTACALQQEILISSESLESLGDSSTRGLLQPPMVFYSNRDILSNSITYVPTLDPPLGVDSVEKKRQLDISPLSHINSIKPTGKERDRAEEKLSKGVVIKERWIKHYSSHQNILLVGEGDFSFSACLALAFGSANNMIATSLNSEGFLRTNYRNATSNIKKLRSRGCKVMHDVDATKVANDLLLESMEFDRIIFNFPHSGFIKNESRKSQLRRHRGLVRQFLANAKKMITENGEIHISHKSYGFFLEWNVEFLASQAGLGLIESVKFNLNDYPGYRTKYGFGGDKNFNCNPSKTYKFGLKKKPKV